MKYLFFSAAIVSGLLFSSCRRTMPAVPDSGRTVVGPRGSSEVEKPWNGTTRQEGDAVLGPLSNMRR